MSNNEKVYILNISDCSKNLYVDYKRKFTSLGLLVTYLIKEYDIFNKENNFSSFQIIMRDSTDIDDDYYKGDDLFSLFRSIPKI